jgi:hypothetical protein
MPMYFMGSIHEVSAILHGSFRFSMRCDSRRPPARSASWIVRHGVVIGVEAFTFTPSGHGTRSHLKLFVSPGSGTSVMLA